MVVKDGNKVLSDNELLEAIADGDRGAFGILMKRYLAGMVTLAHRIVFDREQAREIAQEAFLRVWQNAAKWDPYGSATFLTWLRLVVVNLSISARRRYREQVSLDAIEELPSGLADGFDYIVASDQKRVVQEALKKLPERQRAAVALYYFDDLPQVEAARSDGDDTPLKSFRFCLLFRARLKGLKKHLSDAKAFTVRRRYNEPAKNSDHDKLMDDAVLYDILKHRDPVIPPTPASLASLEADIFAPIDSPGESCSGGQSNADMDAPPRLDGARGNLGGGACYRIGIHRRPNFL